MLYINRKMLNRHVLAVYLKSLSNTHQHLKQNDFALREHLALLGSNSI